MSFYDLPKDWARRAITDPQIFTDVVDLFVTDADRAAGAVYVVLCGPTRRVIQPCTVPELPGEPVEDRGRYFLPFAHAIAGSGGGLVVVIARPGRARAIDSDRLWHHAAVETCRNSGVELFAAAIATPHGVVRLPDPEAEAIPA